MSRWPTIRDLLIFALGAYAFLHEVQGAVERPYVLLAALALMGLPVFLPGGLAEILRHNGKKD